MDVTKDPDFLAAAKTQQLEVSPVNGEQIQDTLARISKTPKDVIRALRDVVLGAEASAAMEKRSGRLDSRVATPGRRYRGLSLRHLQSASSTIW